MLVSAVLHSDSVTHTHTHTHTHPHILFQDLFHYSLLKNIKYNSLCYAVRTCYLCILYMVTFKFNLVADRCYIYKKANWLPEEALQIAEERREAKSKRERERYSQLNA